MPFHELLGRSPDPLQGLHRRAFAVRIGDHVGGATPVVDLQLIRMQKAMQERYPVCTLTTARALMARRRNHGGCDGRPRVHRRGSAALDGTARAQPCPSSPQPHVSGALLWSTIPLLQGCSPHHAACYDVFPARGTAFHGSRVVTPWTGGHTPPSAPRCVTPRTALALAILPRAPGAVGGSHGQGAVGQYSIPPGTRHCWVASSWRSRHRETAAQAAPL